MAATKDPKRHWHLMVYAVPGPGHTVQASQYLSTKKRLPTVPEIIAGRDQHGIPKDAVIVNAAYLGTGTQGEFTGVKAPTAETAA